MNIPSIPPLAAVGLLITPVQTAAAPSEPFQPPAENSPPDSAFGEMVHQGQMLFVEIRKNVPHLVGGQLNCINCHFKQGRRANSALQWAAYLVYPVSRAKSSKVNTFAECLQGCFQSSMNGKVPAADSSGIKALIVYVYQLTDQASTEVSLPGRGYPGVALLEGGYGIERGAKIYTAQCAICHDADGQDQMALGQAVFPLLWDAQSFNWGTGMHHIGTVASSIEHSISSGKSGTSNDRDAWNVAVFMNGHERSQGPYLMSGSAEKTRQKFYVNDGVNLYGQKINGVLLGQEI